MQKKHSRLGSYIAIAIPLILVTVILRTVALFIDFDIRTNYFDSKIIINIASVILALGGIFLFTYAFFSESKKPLVATFASPITFVPTLVTVVALIYFAIGMITKTSSLGITFAEAIATKSIMYFMYAALSLLSLLATGYFLMNALVEKRASENRAGLGLAAVLFLALYSAHFFFNTELQLNAPNKVVDQIAYLFAALFFLYEIRISLGRECWNLYIGFGFISASLLAYSAFPSLIYYLVKGESVSASIFETALTLSLFLFVAARIALTASLGEDKVSDTVTLIKEAFEKRNAALSESEPTPEPSADEPLADADRKVEFPTKPDTSPSDPTEPDEGNPSDGATEPIRSDEAPGDSEDAPKEPAPDTQPLDTAE
ncbi:MAG: hypothetical protein IJY18_00630 [Clostridia bacterium]|nr:hypothetical protein [Clostridia bacterium]